MALWIFFTVSLLSQLLPPSPSVVVQQLGEMSVGANCEMICHGQSAEIHVLNVKGKTWKTDSLKLERWRENNSRRQELQGNLKCSRPLLKDGSVIPITSKNISMCCFRLQLDPAELAVSAWDAAGPRPVCRGVWVPSWDELVGVTFVAGWPKGPISFLAPRPTPIMLQDYTEKYVLKQE